MFFSSQYLQKTWKKKQILPHPQPKKSCWVNHHASDPWVNFPAMALWLRSNQVTKFLEIAYKIALYGLDGVIVTPLISLKSSRIGQIHDAFNSTIAIPPCSPLKKFPPASPVKPRGRNGAMTQKGQAGSEGQDGERQVDAMHLGPGDPGVPGGVSIYSGGTIWLFHIAMENDP